MVCNLFMFCSSELLVVNMVCCLFGFILFKVLLVFLPVNYLSSCIRGTFVCSAKLSCDKTGTIELDRNVCLNLGF